MKALTLFAILSLSSLAYSKIADESIKRRASFDKEAAAIKDVVERHELTNLSTALPR